MAFVHLHVHSQYTLLDGVLTPEELVRGVAELGQPAVALTDRANLFGAVAFFKAARAAGVHPVIGAELAVVPEPLERAPREPTHGYNLVLLVEDERGYRNLCALITRAIFDGMAWKPRVDLPYLREHREGLIALTASLKGPVGRPLLRDQPEEARRQVEELAGIFGPEHLYLELQDNALPGQERVNGLARRLAAELGLETVVTNAVHYLRPEGAVDQQVLHAIATGRPLDGPEARPLPSDQLYLKSEEEMRALFPEDGPALDRTAELAERCRFAFTFGNYHFPATTPPDPEPEADTDANWEYFYRAFPPPHAYGLPEPEQGIPPRVEGAGNLPGYFAWYARTGLEVRLRDVPQERHAAYWERLERELRIITEMKFPAYLLIVAEFINWAKDHGIPVGPGRGSAAGSLAAWAMRITDVDPLRFSLLFERFLNPERVSMPDIDVDFCQDRREEVIEHVREKYGAPLVSQIITFGKLQAKLAFKDVARAAGMLFSDADRLAKLIPDELNIKLERALEEPAFAAVVEGDPLVRRVVNLARRIEGRVRQTGVHAAGVVISDRPLVDYAPLYRDSPEGGPVVQYDMKSAESVGLIKFDFLGLKTLDQIRDTLALVERNTGERIDPSRIPLDDPETYALLQRGDTLGVFQVESGGMRDLLQRLKPRSIDEVIALIALYRPGPMQAGMVDDYVERKHGRRPVEYLHPDLEPILESTYGVVLYQEQVMQTAQVLAGYSLGEADLLRRAMGKKKVEEMARQKTRFLAGAKERGLDEALAEHIFDLLAKFAGYGFNKSHSAAYGLVAYQTAWLKTHHRAEFMAALMSIEAANTDKVTAYIEDCRKAGIEILPPDVNESRASFDVPPGEPKRIRFGLAAVKNVGGSALESILQAREERGGRFEDLSDFLAHVDLSRVNKRVVESLVRAGAFDWTGHSRRSLEEGLDAAFREAQRVQEERASGQVSLFGGPAVEASPKLRLPELPEWPTSERLAREKEALGFFISGHPLDAYGEDLARHVTCTLDRLPSLEDGRRVRVVGMVTGLKTPRTRKGDRMAVCTLQDQRAQVECVFFGEAYQRSRQVLASDGPVLVVGELQRRDSGLRLRAESAEPVSAVLGRATLSIQLRLRLDELSRERLEELDGLLRRFPGDCPVELLLSGFEGAELRYRLGDAHRVAAEDGLRDALEGLFGRPGVARYVG